MRCFLLCSTAIRSQKDAGNNLDERSSGSLAAGESWTGASPFREEPELLRESDGMHLEGTIPPETNSNDFGVFGIIQQIRIRFSSLRKLFF